MRKSWSTVSSSPGALCRISSSVAGLIPGERTSATPRSVLQISDRHLRRYPIRNGRVASKDSTSRWCSWTSRFSESPTLHTSWSNRTEKENSVCKTKNSVRLFREYSNPARPKSDADLSENETEIRFAKPPYCFIDIDKADGLPSRTFHRESASGKDL